MLGGFYPTGTSGVFGSAAAAARLLGLSSEKTAHAFGIAGSMASGIVECAESGGMVKRMHAGRAAEGGVTAAYLARRGFTGPTTVLEGKFGFCQTFSDKPALDLLLDGLGTNYKIRETTVKPYACCSDIHPVIDALLEIKGKHAFAPSTVKQIVVEGPKKICELNNIDGTTSMMAAQYSVPFIAAIALSEDIRDPAVYQDSILSRTDLAALQRKVEMQVDEEFDRLFPKRIAARVTVTLDDGRKLVATNRGAVGSIHNPMSQAQIEAKFMALAGPILPDETADEVMRLIRNIEDNRSIAPLTSLLRFDIGAGRKAAPVSAVARA
jgi:2-methylcitrate dehydratase PrpD